jgi:hypothetical protein
MGRLRRGGVGLLRGAVVLASLLLVVSGEVIFEERFDGTVYYCSCTNLIWSRYLF